MRIGLTYDLRDDYRDRNLSEEALAEFDSPETIAAIEGALRELGYETDRIGHVRALAARLVAGDRWDMVFNIAEGVRGRSREAQVPALLEAWDIRYVFSDPLTQAVTLDKAVAKRLVRDAGVPTARFHLIEDEADAATCRLPYPVFLKPVAEGTGKGCTNASIVHNRKEMLAEARSLITRFGQGALAETYLSGREFTVGVVGNGRDARVIGVMEIALNGNADPGVYSFDNKELCDTRVEYRLAHDDTANLAGTFALAAYRTLGCRDASRLDFRCDGRGIPHFLEVNTMAGLHPTHSDLPMLAAFAGLAYRDLIGEIVYAACARQGLHGTHAQRLLA
jgi:D-alanine-D-alanine ligase